MRKLAFNPLPWFMTPDGFHPELAPPLEFRLGQIKEAGYDGVHADVPPGMAVGAHRAALDDAGLQRAPGYFQWAFSEPDMIDEGVDRGALEAAQHAELGLDRAFLADSAFAAPRFAAPSIGIARDDTRALPIAERIERVARAMAAEGVVELEQILTSVHADVRMLGPDTGHLAWAGAIPVSSSPVTVTASGRST